jgi:putative hydrolase of the HAD superfamily
MTRLKAVLFDIDDTLYSTTAFARSARRNAVQAMVQTGIRLGEEEVANELDEVIREFGSNFEHHYDKLLMRLPHEAWAGANPAMIVAAGVVAYHDTKFQELQPFPDVKPLLSGLRGAGVRTGIVTHGWTVKQAEKLIRLRILPYLDPEAIFISDQVGISKPNPKLYSLALRSMKLPASEVMYVGDSLSHDIAPPKSLGMVAVWTRRAAKPDQDIEQIVPHHVVEDFRDLARVLRDDYGVPLVEF